MVVIKDSYSPANVKSQELTSASYCVKPKLLPSQKEAPSQRTKKHKKILVLQECAKQNKYHTWAGHILFVNGSDQQATQFSRRRSRHVQFEAHMYTTKSPFLYEVQSRRNLPLIDPYPAADMSIHEHMKQRKKNTNFLLNLQLHACSCSVQVSLCIATIAITIL